MAAVLCAAFADFAPTAARWFDAVPPGRADQHLVAERLTALQAAPRPRHFGDLRLRPATAAVHARYAAMVARLSPAQRALTAKETPQSLTTCAAAGALFTAEVDGLLAGLIAARPEPLLGLPAWVVVAEVLDAPFRGRGLGPAIQRHLVERLPGDGWLWGTIAAGNAPSLRTAARVGRRVIGGWGFIDVPPTR